MNSTATIFARLAGVSASLSTHNGTPAIFSERAPDDFLDAPPERPFIIIAAPTRDEPLETFTEVGRAVVQDIRCYQRDNGSSRELDDVMQSVRTLFHNRPEELSVIGGKCDLSRVSGPIQSPTSDESMIGRRLTLRLDLIQD
ncbi:hypothetical protein D3C72_1543350 [compost metagenome]